VINNQPFDKSEPQAQPASISEDSVTQIAYSLASEQNEKEAPVKHRNSQQSNAPEGATRKQDDIRNALLCFKLTSKPLLKLPMLFVWAKSQQNLRFL